MRSSVALVHALLTTTSSLRGAYAVNNNTPVNVAQCINGRCVNRRFGTIRTRRRSFLDRAQRGELESFIKLVAVGRAAAEHRRSGLRQQRGSQQDNFLRL